MSSSMSSLNPPQTPQGQRGFPRSSQTIPTSVLTPEAQEKFKTLKRKASELSDQDSPKTASLFLQWRRSILAHEITMLNYLREQYKETLDLGRIDKETYEDYRGQIVSTLEKYENELAVILEQNQFLRQDIQDNSADIAEEAYVEELYNSFRKASDEGQKEQRQKKQRAMPRKEFRKKVTEYLDTFRQETPTSSDEAWCLALGQWLPSSMVKCAHIVPFSFESKELSYLFGVEDSALTSAKNGLFFNRVVEAGFDNGWIVIVPDGSVDSTPTEWKIILLNEKIKNDTIYTGPAPERQITRWVDLNDRKLKFRNQNRPARRYMYFRYAMAYMYAQRSGFPDLKSKLPNGQIWASPGKPGGYLRRSVLQSLAKRIGDEPLPSELLIAGTFTDTEPRSATDVQDCITEIELSRRMSRRLESGPQKADDDEIDTDDENDE